jgi:hypothetical protein
MRIHVLAGCLAIGATAVILTGTAAHATSLSGVHPDVAVTASSNPPTTGPPSTGCPGNGNYGYGNCQSETPTPQCTCQKTTPPPSYSPPPTVTATPTQTVTPEVTTTTPVPPSSSAPPSAPQTGGGGSIGGGNGPLAAGGVATALAAGLIGTLAYRRWRRTRFPVA